jgi:hypothetical protein
VRGLRYALVLCVDEKSQIQALDRTASCLPMLPTTPARMTHDYVRNGTTSLFAAFELSSGWVIAQSYRRHRHQEFLRFLKLIDQAVPDDLDLHLVLDNYATHKTPSVTVKFTGTASTYPLPACSQASRSLELRPYTSSPATHANGIPASAAPVNHLRAEGRLGGERRLLRHVRLLPPRLAGAPGFGQVEPEIGQHVGAGGDVGGEHHRLAVLHLPGDPGMLPGHAGRGGPLLQLGGLV